MKTIFTYAFILMTYCSTAQYLRISISCYDVKIINEYTNDTINRCDLSINIKEALNKICNEYELRVIEDMFGPADAYHCGKDVFAFYHDTSYNQGGFSISTNYFKLFIDNKYLVQVGDNIDDCFEEFKPIPIREDQGRTTSAVFFDYIGDTKVERTIMASALAIIFDNKTRKIIRIHDATKR